MGIVAIGSNGVLRAVYDDSLVEALSVGTIRIKRASRVEFCNESQAWFVDMQIDEAMGIESFRAGPFRKRADALAWEVAYLNARLSGLSDTEACQLAGKEKRDEDTY